MRANNCACPCQSCQQGLAYDCPGYEFRERGDQIEFNGIDANNDFSVSVRRKIGYPASTPTYFYFNICIPMNGDIGIRHFTTAEGLVDCYAFIRRYHCTDNRILYYFWIAYDINTIEPPKMNPDPTKYLTLYTVGGKPIYYIAQNEVDILAGAAYSKIPSTMSHYIPYIFWAAPSSYKIDLTFVGGSVSIGWCNWNGTITNSGTFQYSMFDGSYIVDSPINLVGQSSYYSQGLYSLNLPNMASLKGCARYCGPCPIEYYDIAFDLYFRLGINLRQQVNAGYAVEIGIAGGFRELLTNTTKFSSPNGAAYDYPFNPVPQIKSNGSTFDCIDSRVLTGNYGRCTYAGDTTSIGCFPVGHGNITCPNLVDLNQRCGLNSTWSSIVAEVDVSVNSWGIDNGCP